MNHKNALPIAKYLAQTYPELLQKYSQLITSHIEAETTCELRELLFQFDMMKCMMRLPRLAALFFKNAYQVRMSLEAELEALLIQEVQSEMRKKKLSLKENQDLLRRVIQMNMRVQLQKVPSCCLSVIHNLRDVEPFHSNKFISMYATVVRIGPSLARERQKQFQCKSCSTRIEAKTDIREGLRFKFPPYCGAKLKGKRTFNENFQLKRNNGAAGPGVEATPGAENQKCQSRTFEPIIGGKVVYSSYQEVRVNSMTCYKRDGDRGRSIGCLSTLIIEGSDCGKLYPGADILVNGIVLPIFQQPTRLGQRPKLDLALYVNQFKKVTNSSEGASQLSAKDLKGELEGENGFLSYWSSGEFFSLMNDLVQAFEPQIVKRYFQKKGLLLALIGGVAKSETNSSGMKRIRGDIHVLLVGEPGTGKSRLLHAAKRLSTKGVMTTGMGSSAAGLTVAAIKQPGSGQWRLEAGALALAHGGVCCVDEFAELKTQDKSAIHEAMEQQTLHVNKAGIHCVVPMQATLLAACNPIINRQKVDSTKDMSVNTGILPSLISRFDLIFTLAHYSLDLLADSTINRVFSQLEPSASAPFQEAIDGAPIKIRQDWLRKYIASCKLFYNPSVGNQAQLLLQKYFIWMRESPLVSQERKTVRLFEGLIRLSQAHARLLLSSTVSQLDAVMIIQLQQVCLFTQLIPQSLLEPVTNKQSYHLLQSRIFTALKVSHKLQPFSFEADELLTSSLALSPHRAITRIYSPIKLQKLAQSEASFNQTLLSTAPSSILRSELSLLSKRKEFEEVDQEEETQEFLL